MEKVIINSIGTPFTIDTYGTFTLDNQAESEFDYYMNEGGIAEDDIELDYDMKAYVNDLGDCLVEFLNENIPKDIIKSFSLKSTHSPQYYNYTTDSADIEVEYDKDALDSYIETEAKKYTDSCKNKSYNISNPMDNDEEKLEFYLSSFEDKKEDWEEEAYELAYRNVYVTATIKEKLNPQ